MKKYVVLIGLLAFVVSCSGSGKRQKEIESEIESIYAVFDKLEGYRTRHFGPPNFEQYMKVFRYTDDYDYPKFPDRYNPEDSPLYDNNAKFLTAFTSDEETLSALKSYLKDTERHWETIREAVENGGCYPSFREDLKVGLMYEMPNFLALNFSSKDNILKSLIYLREGETTESVDLLAFGIDLNQRIFGRNLIGDLMGVALIDKTVSAFDYILWHPADRSDELYALDKLNSISYGNDENSLRLGGFADRFTPLFFCEGVVEGYVNVIRSSYLGRIRDEDQREFVLMHYVSVMGALLMAFNENPEMIQRPENKKWLRRMSKQCGYGEDSVGATWNLALSTKKLTTLPAWRKHFKHIVETEEFFKTGYFILDRADLAGLPPEMIISIFCENTYFNLVEYNCRIDVSVTKLNLVRTAFAARVFKKQHGEYPSNSLELVEAGLIDSPSTPFDENMRIIDLYGNGDKWLENVDGIVMSKMTGHLLEGLSTDLKPTDTHNTLKFDMIFDSIVEKNFTMIADSMGFYEPLVHVENAKHDEEKTGILTGTYARPEDLWCAYSIGPDKKDDQGLILYDPTNGTLSAGDIIQIIGYE